jgi:hypothetical protein
VSSWPQRIDQTRLCRGKRGETDRSVTRRTQRFQPGLPSIAVRSRWLRHRAFKEGAQNGAFNSSIVSLGGALVVVAGRPQYQFGIFHKVRYEGVARVQQSDCPVCGCDSDVLFTVEPLQSGWPLDGLQLGAAQFGFIRHLPEI